LSAKPLNANALNTNILNTKTPNGQTKSGNGGRWPLLIAALLIVALIFSFSGSKGVLPVRAATVERGTIRSQISTNGKVEPVKNFEARALTAATVRRVFVHEGDHVKRGQLLLQLEDADARTQAAHANAQLRSAEAEENSMKNGGTHEEVVTTEADLSKARSERDTAQRNLDAVRRLNEKGAASQGEVRDAESQLTRASTQVTLLEEKLKNRYSTPEVAKVQAQASEARASMAAASNLLSKSNIRAPQDGIVYALPVREGSYVNAGDLLLEEADLSKVLVRAFVDEPDVGRLHLGQRIEITWDALPGRTWQGEVTVVPASLHLLGTRNVGELTSVTDNKDLALLPNVNVGVAIVTAEHRDTLYVPREALRQDPGGQLYVFDVAGGSLTRRDVTTAIATLTQMEVEGIPEKTQVALGTTNGKPLVSGATVKVVN
jgi:HlyD family secretion protein